MRIDKQPPGRPARGDLQHGQTVQGRVSEKNGRQFLHHAGGRTAVSVEGAVPPGVARFQILVQQGKILLRPLTGPVSSGKSPAAVPMPELFTRLFPDAARRLGEAGRTPGQSPSLLEMLFHGLLVPREAERALELLRFYERKKGANQSEKDADNAKELPLPLLDLLGGVLGSAAAGEREGGGGQGARERREELAFALLPLQAPSGAIQFVPVLTLGMRRGGKRAWLFSECAFSRIGMVRVALFLAGGKTCGMLYCEPGMAGRLESLARDGRYRILERPDPGDFRSWPFRILEENEEALFDGTI